MLECDGLNALETQYSQVEIDQNSPLHTTRRRTREETKQDGG